MSIRIIAGALRGRRIDVPAGRSVRPTGSRVREAWFSALGDRVEGAAVIDLFAGSGALGIEALSRGASRVRFVEANRRSFDVLRRNIEGLGLSARAELQCGDVSACLATQSGERRFDLALADPPYGRGLARDLVARFHQQPFAELLCVEHGLDDVPAEEPVWRRTYGDTMLSFFTVPKGGDSGER